MAYQILVTINGYDGKDTTVGKISANIPIQVFLEKDNKPMTYNSMKYLEELVEKSIQQSKTLFLEVLVDKINKV